MKIKILLNSLLILQLAFFLWILFTAPEQPAHLRFALKDLKSGDVSNAADRISGAIHACELQGQTNLLVTFGGLVLSFLLSLCIHNAQKVSSGSQNQPGKSG